MPNRPGALATLSYQLGYNSATNYSSCHLASFEVISVEPTTIVYTQGAWKLSTPLEVYGKDDMVARAIAVNHDKAEQQQVEHPRPVGVTPAVIVRLNLSQWSPTLGPGQHCAVLCYAVQYAPDFRASKVHATTAQDSRLHCQLEHLGPPTHTDRNEH